MMWSSLFASVLAVAGLNYASSEWVTLYAVVVAIATLCFATAFTLFAWAEIRAIRQNRWDVLCPWVISGMTQKEADEFVLHVNQGVPMDQAVDQFISVHRGSVL